MQYDRKLAMEICQEMGIEWGSNATRTTVGGKPIPENLTMEGLFQNVYEELNKEYCRRERNDTGADE